MHVSKDNDLCAKIIGCINHELKSNIYNLGEIVGALELVKLEMVEEERKRVGENDTQD